mmetsp:Transcript_49540/g.115997  ORF Transcript_49540/g.115997 Transcript_49540/m.115997 type:complete len:822 (-) Transcript_49540:12-2477(-)
MEVLALEEEAAAVFRLLEFARDGAKAASADEAAEAARLAAPTADAHFAAAAAADADAVAAGEREEEDEYGLALTSVERLLRSALRQHCGRKVDAQLVDTIVSSLRGVKEAAGKDVDEDADGGGSERVKSGLIAWTDFKVYLRLFGHLPILLLLLAAAVASAGLAVYTNVYLSRWTDANTGCAVARAAGREDDPACAPEVQRAALFAYLSLGAGSQLCVCLEALLLTAAALRASRRLHAKVLSSLLGAPLSFFERTASGSVLNRLLADVQNIDTYVPNALSDMLGKLLQMGTQLGLVLAFAPWVAAALPLLLPVYVCIFRRVRPASRDSRRLESAAHSPVYAHFGDALAGRETIFAFGAEARFCAQNAALVGDMSRANLGNEAVNKWAQALTTQTGCFLYAACGICCVLLARSGKLSSSQLGLVLLYASSLQRAAMDLMMQLTNIETQFVSVERLAEYTRLESEEEELAHPFNGEALTLNRADQRRSGSLLADGHSHAHALHALSPARTPAFSPGSTIVSQPISWPKPAGDLSLRNVWLRYRPDRPPVLRGISLHLPHGRKVALCGRTGCGKSSLFAAIARLYPLERGDICIGALSTVSHSLATARAAVRVVSQDAELLEGSLRANLLADYTDTDSAVAHYADAASRLTSGGAYLGLNTTSHLSLGRDGELWAALEQAGVAERVRLLPGGLDAKVQASEFSEGERQLLSLARALVGRPALLLADEPTACVDLMADARVHDVLLGLESTVLMICHRLQHVARFDEVLVMDAGRVVEQGAPAELLGRPGSCLARLCARAGLDPAELLAAAAAAAARTPAEAPPS